jgi:hypothetical protein
MICFSRIRTRRTLRRTRAARTSARVWAFSIFFRFARTLVSQPIISTVHLFNYIPIFVARPARAAQARSPFPLMPAAGAAPARFKRVPARITAAVEIFGRVRIGAPPAARCVGRPIAVRAANPFKIGFCFFPLKFLENFFRFRSFLVSHKIPSIILLLSLTGKQPRLTAS